MSSFPWLTTLIVLPLVGAVVLWALPPTARAAARQVALAFGDLREPARDDIQIVRREPAVRRAFRFCSTVSAWRLASCPCAVSLAQALLPRTGVRARF